MMMHEHEQTRGRICANVFRIMAWILGEAAPDDNCEEDAEELSNEKNNFSTSRLANILKPAGEKVTVQNKHN